MGRRRHNLYVRPLPTSTQVVPDSAAGHTQYRTHSSPARALSNIGFVHTLRSYLDSRDSSARVNKEKKGHQLRSFLQRILCFNAICVFIETVLGFFVVTSDQDGSLQVKKDCMKAAVCLLSIFQVGMVVGYWKGYTDYMETVEMAMSSSYVLRKGLLYSPLMLAGCILEAAVYLITFYPGVSSQLDFTAFYVNESFDDLVYILVLFRSYQAARLLYWISPFSDMRAHIFTRVTTVAHNQGFVMRCCIARYGFILMAVLIAVIVTIPGVMQFVLERREKSSGMNVIWNGFWVVAYTLPNIGYGNIHPVTLLGQMCIVAVAIFGSLVLGFLTTVSRNSLNLSLPECDMCSHLLYTRQKRRYTEDAVVTLQRWWHLMKMRLVKKVDGKVILAYYSQLRTYRTTLVACQRAKDTLFLRQITAFDKATHRSFDSLNEYLQPIKAAHPLLHDLFRSEYRIKSLCRELSKQYRRTISFLYPQMPHDIHTTHSYSDYHDPPFTPFTGKTRSGHFAHHVKAKNNALQNLRSRLIKEEIWAVPVQDTLPRAESYSPGVDT